MPVCLEYRQVEISNSQHTHFALLIETCLTFDKEDSTIFLFASYKALFQSQDVASRVACDCISTTEFIGESKIRKHRNCSKT